MGFIIHSSNSNNVAVDVPVELEQPSEIINVEIEIEATCEPTPEPLPEPPIPTPEIKPTAIISSDATGTLFGVWDPYIQGGNIIDITVRHSRYTKVGRQVTCTFEFTVTNIVGGKNDAVLSLGGLPHMSIGGSLFVSKFSELNSNVNSISGTVDDSVRHADLWCTDGLTKSSRPLTLIDIKINTTLVGVVTYIANS